MKSASLIRYDIHRWARAIEAQVTEAGRHTYRVKLAKSQAMLPVAERRELKRLAKYLTYKADIYGPRGRIYGFKAKFHVTTDGKLFHGDVELDPSSLEDGNGRLITVS